MAARITIQATAAAGAMAVVALLSGCQQGGMSSPLMSTTNYGLHLIDEGDSAKLAYGEANSDNVGLMLECAKGSRTIEVSDVARGDGAKLNLKSGAARAEFKGKVVAGPGAAVVAATGAADAPVMRAFRDSGKMEVETAGRRYDVNATPGEQAEVKRFFAMCERV